MLIYQNEKGDTKVDGYFFEKDIWMSQGLLLRCIIPHHRILPCILRTSMRMVNWTKIQQRQVLSEGMEYDYMQRGMSINEAKQFIASNEGRKQVALAEKINKMARLLGCQFIIATHSPFMLGTLNAKIYNLDTKEYDVVKWSELENVRYFYDFFKKHKEEFTLF